jgi:hypothetical protein
MTNAEKINQMSVHEKAQWIMNLQEDNCSGCFYYKKHEGIWICIKETFTYAGCLMGREKWLEAEADNDEEG